jgi:hypothetical protein
MKDRGTESNAHSIIRKVTLKKLGAAYKWNGTFRTTKTIASLRLRRKTINRKTKETTGDSNRPLGLLLERKMIMTYKSVSGAFLSKLTPCVDVITVDHHYALRCNKSSTDHIHV